MFLNIKFLQTDMLTYTPPSEKKIEPTGEKPWVLLLLVFAWLWPGVFSHGLWNPNEPMVAQAVREWSEGGLVWLPTVFGRPYWDLPLPYTALAAGLRRLFSPEITDAYSAMRMASVVFSAIGLAACGVAGFRLLGRHQGRSVVLMLIGSAGLITAAHFLGGMSVQLAGVGLCLYGLSLIRTRVIMAAVWLALGWMLLSLSAGYLITAAMMIITALLVFSQPWHSKRTLIALVCALLIAAPLISYYPLALYKSMPPLFDEWLKYHIFGNFGGAETFALDFNLWYYLKNAVWFAFPSWPLAVWSTTRCRLKDTDWGVLSLIWLGVFAVVFALIPERFQDNLIWILPPMALLGAAKLDSLRRGAAAFLNWFGIATFGLLAMFLWLGFFAMNYGWPAKLAERSAYFSPYYIPDIDIMPMIVALSFTPLWLFAITRKHIKGRQAVTNWAAGITLTWALMMTLFLQWLDAAKSYEPVVRQMEASAPAELLQGKGCLNIDTAAQNARLAWTEYSRIPLQTDNPTCAYRLIQAHKQSELPQGWQVVWSGSRPRNPQETVFLLEKQKF